MRSVRSDTLFAVAALAPILMLVLFYLANGTRPGDAYTYLAAGERLNAGHDLYALGIGDRPVPLSSGERSPLLSPPLVAVVWRPLAALPGEAGVLIWWSVTSVALASVVWVLLSRARRPAAIALTLLALSLTFEAFTGNVNALLIAGALIVWASAASGRWWVAGGLVATMVALKLTPFPLLVWVLVIGARRGAQGVALGLVAAVGIGVIGAGLPAHVDYLHVLTQASSMSLSTTVPSGLGYMLGIPPDLILWGTRIMLACGTLGVLLLRRAPAAAWVLAVATWAFGTPAIFVNTPALLLAALAPLAWPWPPAGPSYGVDDGVDPVTSDLP